MNTPLPPGRARLRPPNRLPRPNDLCWCGADAKYKKCHASDDQTFLREERIRLELNKVQKGEVSPMRSVPAHIVRPDYVPTGHPVCSDMPLVRTADEIERMRRAGAAAARVLRLVGEAAKPGVTTEALDALAHEEIIRLGGYPSTLGYRGFPKSLCSSVNEVVCHGIPDSRALRDGDILNIDVTVFLDGVHGDTNRTFLIGDVDEESQQLVRVTRECFELGIAAVKPGRPVSDIGRAIEQHAETYGYGVVRAFCGHGVGPVFQSSLQIPHVFDRRADDVMVPGMTFTIEPMINAGTFDVAFWDDEWTAVTKDLRRSAQFEHSLVVTETGCDILTVER